MTIPIPADFAMCALCADHALPEPWLVRLPTGLDLALDRAVRRPANLVNSRTAHAMSIHAVRHHGLRPEESTSFTLSADREGVVYFEPVGR